MPTHVSVLARYQSGQSAAMIFSFDSAQGRTMIELNGSDGTRSPTRTTSTATWCCSGRTARNPRC